MTSKIKLNDFVGADLEDNFLEFDLTEIQDILSTLKSTEVIDLAHAELLQLKSLRGADIISEYLGKIIKTIGTLEAKINTVRNKVSLDYKAPDGSRTTTDMRVWAGNSSPEVEEISIKLAKAKASKVVLEKKFDILIKHHHYCKDLAAGYRKTVLGYSPISDEKIPEGY